MIRQNDAASNVVRFVVVVFDSVWYFLSAGFLCLEVLKIRLLKLCELLDWVKPDLEGIL